MKKLFFLFLCILQFQEEAITQDPAYQNFIQNRFLFNPALTGSNGAQSWKFRSKLQWNNDGGGGYKTLSLQFEETMPCSIVDLGFKMNYNEEGAGLYRTMEAGMLASAFITPPFNTLFSDHNIKVGLDFSWGLNTIDFSRLIWSDQLDPKYGVRFPTSFVPPNDGQSSVYFNPGLGFSWRAVWNKKSPKAWMTNMGLAMYRFISVQDGEVNQSVSVLGLKNTNPYRLTGFFESEWVMLYFNSKFISLRPSVLYQKQGNINYAEAGVRAGYLRDAGIGVYYHTAPGNDFGQTPWISLSTDFMVPVGKGKKMELSFTFSENVGGLQNFSGPQFEIGISYHLAKSSVCNLLGFKDDVPYDNSYKCPIMAITPGKRKIYENIWYKN